jgi:hypothetical protein
MCSSRICVGTRIILAEIFLGFPQSFEASAVDSQSITTRPLHLICLSFLLSPYKWTACNLAYEESQRNAEKEEEEEEEGPCTYHANTKLEKKQVGIT